MKYTLQHYLSDLQFKLFIEFALPKFTSEIKTKTKQLISTNKSSSKK